MKPAASFVLWAVALMLTGVAVLAQIEMATKAAMTVADRAASRDVTYLAVVFSFCAMGFAWWQSRQLFTIAHESNVAAVETARALQRLVDNMEGKPTETRVDEDINELLQRRRKK